MPLANTCHLFIGFYSGKKFSTGASLMAQIGKPIEKEKYKKVVQIAHKNNIEVRGAFIIGHVNETKETLEETLQFAIDLDLDFFQPSILTPYPGTQLYAELKQKGILLHEQYDLYGQGEVLINMPNLSKKELLDFYYWSFIRFYFRPKAVWKQLKRLNSVQQIKDLFKTFYIILFEKLKKDRSTALQQWLKYDLQAHRIAKVDTGYKERLTYQVRQSQEFQ